MQRTLQFGQIVALFTLRLTGPGLNTHVHSLDVVVARLLTALSLLRSHDELGLVFARLQGTTTVLLIGAS